MTDWLSAHHDPQDDVLHQKLYHSPVPAGLANRTSELKALQAQIILTLSTIRSSALEGGNLPLYQSITALGQMMHYSMDTAHNLVPINDALHYIELYLKLQKLVFPTRWRQNLTYPMRQAPC